MNGGETLGAHSEFEGTIIRYDMRILNSQAV